MSYVSKKEMAALNAMIAKRVPNVNSKALNPSFKTMKGKANKNGMKSGGRPSKTYRPKPFQGYAGKKKPRTFKERYDKGKNGQEGGLARPVRKTPQLKLVEDADLQQGMANAQPVLPFFVSPSPDVFIAPVIGLISIALSKGWMYGSNNLSNPYLACNYVCQMLWNACINATPQTLQVPKCIAWIMQAIVQKVVPSAQGRVSYQFDFTPPSSVQYNQPMGPGGNSTFLMGVPNPSVLIDGEWQSVTAPSGSPSIYGAQAWTSLLQFLTTNCNEEAMEMVSSTDQNFMSKDVSAFSVLLPNPGGGQYGVGGWGYTASSEVGIRSPFYAKFYNNTTGINDLNRYPNVLKQCGGDGIFIASSATFYRKKWVNSNKAPIFKAVDLNEFVEVAALVYKKAIYQAITDPTSQSNNIVNGQVQQFLDNYTMPCTLQEFWIMIRNEVMNIYKESQPVSQGVYTRSVQGGDNVFTPLVCGSNVCALPCAQSMMMPDALVENIKAFTYVIADYMTKRKKNGALKASNSPRIVVPVLGVYSLDTFTSSDYDNIVTIEGTDFTVATFQPDTGVVISPIDGKSGSDYAFINDPAVLNNLITLFNTWVNKLSPFVTALSTPSTDAGIKALSNAGCTMYWQAAGGGNPFRKESDIDKVHDVVEQKKFALNMERRRKYYADLDAYTRECKGGQSPSVGKKRHPPAIDFEPTWFEKRDGKINHNNRHLSTSPYASRVIQAYTFYKTPLNVIWESIQQVWIKPQINAAVGIGVSDANDVLRLASLSQEFNQLIAGETSNILTIATQHDQFASTMVTARNGTTKSFSEILRENNIDGNGNIFDDIVSSVSNVTRIASAVAPLAATLF